MKRRFVIAGLLSGGGRTLLNILDEVDAGRLDVEVRLAIASRASAPGIDRVRERGIEVRVARQRDFASEDALHDTISAWLADAGVDLVCLCGYLRWMRIDPWLQGRVINIHPSLLPEFGGKGMHGMHVHRAVLEAKRRFSGCTVHIVDEQYDHGPTVLQRTCPVLPDDDAESLAARVFEQECLAYPAAIHLFATGQVDVRDGAVHIGSRTAENAGAGPGAG